VTAPHQPDAPPTPAPDVPAGSEPVPGRAAAPHLDPAVAGLLQQPAAVRRRRPWQGAPAAEQPSAADLDAWTATLSTPVPSPRRIGVVALKGGVGKTTLSVLLAGTLARARQDPVLLFDADTTFGSLALRTGVPLTASAHELAAAGDPGRFDILAGALARSGDGAWVLPSGRDPEQSAALTEAVYIGAMNAVFSHFAVMVTDCGAGLATPLMRRVVSGCHSLVLATSPSVDGILASHNVLRWLRDSGFSALADRSVVALTNVPAEGAGVDVAETLARFAPLAGDVVPVPADPHLSTGGRLDLDALAGATRTAAVRLAASALGAALAAP
jgi:MinD-like ATPase involved in chromosome partitioning or flagellar assembly